MIEILVPDTDHLRIERLLGDGFALVDGWESGLAELTALCALGGDADAFDPHDLDASSRYVVYPWRRCVVRLPDPELFHRLRTTRNRYLITDDEQVRWSSSLIAVAGLSVGGSVLHTCALTGARRFVITDPDTLGPSNLNRLSGSVCDLGVAKTVLAARRISELDPYSEIEVVDGGYQPDGPFLARRPAVVLEEMDDLRRKIELRLRARDLRIPVVMVTDDGDGVMVDVERFDIEPERPILHGRVEALLAEGLDVLDDPARRVEHAGTIVGDDIADRMRYSLGQVGRTIGSWPQLGTAATLAGAVGAALARRIVVGDEVPSGRAHVRLEDLRLC